MPGVSARGCLHWVTFLGRRASLKRAANDDATFKSAENLKAIYEGEAGLTPDGDTIVYCRIGERSSTPGSC